MSAQAFETALARLYTESGFRARFLESPEAALEDFDLAPMERIDLCAIDVKGLLMASHSFGIKRSKRAERRNKTR